MVKVQTIDGNELVINKSMVLMAAKITADGAPVLGQCRIMLLGGIGLMINESLDSLLEKLGG